MCICNCGSMTLRKTQLKVSKKKILKKTLGWVFHDLNPIIIYAHIIYICVFLGLQWIEHPIGGALSDAICFLLWMCLMVNAILMAVVQVALLDCRKRLMSGLVIISILGKRIISHKTYGKTYTNGYVTETHQPLQKEVIISI